MSSEDFIEGPSKTLGECPFQEGKCIADKCHLWVEKERTEDESIGNCAFLKSYHEMQGINTSLNVIVVFVIFNLILIILGFFL